MSRGFFGSGGSGGGINRGKSKKDAMKAMMAFSNKRNKTQNELIKERTTHAMPDYNEMLQDMLDEKMTSTSRAGFHLPGTTPPEEKAVSRGRQMAIDHYKMKRMRQRMKIRDNKVEVIPKNYGGVSGGWIDKNGKIRNKDGLVVMEVNLTNGEIRNSMGLKVGKYNPHSVSNDFKIQRLIDKYTAAKGVFNPFGGNPANNKFNPFGAKED